MLDKSLIDEISKRADIVSVVSNYIKLTKKGRIYVGICPFHDDSNPSLQVNPERNTFHCWVDGHSGNAFSFVMQYEHVGFVEAVKKVASIINFDDLRLHENRYVKKIDETLIPLTKCIDDLNLFYEYSLSSEEGQTASKYLKERNITPEIIKKFHIGYALNDGTKTIKFLQSKGHSLKTIEDIGIATNLGEKTHDSNQGRITFAIYNSNNQVVGFSARRINESDGPKYVNSPETKLFIKGQVLYNFANAQIEAKNLGYIYLLEGFMDVIALNKAKINNAVALMGTALSKDHIKMLKQLNVEVRLCLDGDLPGQEASMRIVPLLLNNNIAVRIVNNLNDNRDPDEILNEKGIDELKRYLNNLLSPFDFVINFYKNSKKLETIDDKKNLIQRFLPLLLATNSQIELDDYIYKLADVTGFAAPAIKDAIAKARKKARNKTNNEEVVVIDPRHLISSFHPERKELMKLARAEEEILYHMLNEPDAIMFYKKNIDCFYTDFCRDLVNYVLDVFTRTNQISQSDVITAIESSESQNAHELINNLENLVIRSHPSYSFEKLSRYKDIIEQEKASLHQKEKINKATMGKSEEEKARIIADILRLENK